MVAHEMDRVLLERTVSFVRSGKLSAGEGRAVSKALRVAIDSRPLEGAGKVEDTLNLLGHAARLIVKSVSKIGTPSASIGTSSATVVEALYPMDVVPIRKPRK